MSRPKILIQLDSDAHPSVFDAVVAVDAGIDHLLQYPRVEPAAVTPLVHGAMFTRGGDDLKSTAIFIGGSEPSAGEGLLKAVKASFFGKIRVSVMLDSNGCNTTAAAAVASASKHLDLSKSRALVLGGSGPVGRRVARLLRSVGCTVKVASRSVSRASEAIAAIDATTKPPSDAPQLIPVEAGGSHQVLKHVEDCDLLIAAGAAGVEFVSTTDTDRKVSGQSRHRPECRTTTRDQRYRFHR